MGAAIHVLIFVMESRLWLQPRIWRRFGVRGQQDAETIAPMAYNQGFYNLFLAIGALLGVILFASATAPPAGPTLMFFSSGCMVFAALVLVTSSPRLARAALVQGLAPALGTLLLAIGLIGQST